MNKKHLITALSLLLCGSTSLLAQKQWTLRECIDYALKNNIEIQKNKVNEASTTSDLKTAKAGLLPSLSASMTQGVSYRPYQETSSIVNGGITSSTSSLATQNGSYGLNASWTIYNGGKNTNSIKAQQISLNQAKYATEQSANTIQEQITQLYVQILYSSEALRVNEELLKNDEVEYNRGKEMKEQGQISLSALTQLEAQVTSGKYDVVNSKTIIANYKLQLKQLLELQGADDFDIISPNIITDAALEDIPNKQEIYATALNSRAEIKSSKLAIEASDVNLKIAKAGYLPTIGLSAGIGDSHITGSGKSYADQIKQNLNGSVGVSISIPIFDNRQNKNAVEKAKLSQITSKLNLQDAEKQIYSSIETYWLNAMSNQQKYISAKDNVKSLQTSYNLLDEQFRLGLKNIIELQTGRSNLLSAKQQMLESKYTTLLNLQLLKFYAGEEIKL